MIKLILSCGVIAGIFGISTNKQFRSDCFDAAESVFEEIRAEIESRRSELVRKPVFEVAEVRVPFDNKFRTKTPERKGILDTTEVYLLAKLLYTETTDSKAINELYAIGATVINRYKLGNAASVFEVMNQPRQYSGFNNPKCANWLKEPTEVHERIANDLYFNGVKDTALSGVELSKVYYFCNRGIVSNSNGKWFDSLEKAGKINQHTFYYK